MEEVHTSSVGFFFMETIIPSWLRQTVSKVFDLAPTSGACVTSYIAAAAPADFAYLD